MNLKQIVPSLLRGYIFCAECGARMIRNYFKRGKYEYEKYRCGSRGRTFKADCRGEGVTVSVMHEWLWREVKELLQLQNEAKPDPQLVLNLAAVRREFARAERALEELTSLTGDYLRPYIAQATHDKQQLAEMIKELEEPINAANQRAADLRRLRHSAPEHLTFDEQRRVLEILGLKVYANGDDPIGWRCEVSEGSSDAWQRHIA